MKYSDLGYYMIECSRGYDKPKYSIFLSYAMIDQCRNIYGELQYLLGVVLEMFIIMPLEIVKSIVGVIMYSLFLIITPMRSISGYRLFLAVLERKLCNACKYNKAGGE